MDLQFVLELDPNDGRDDPPQAWGLTPFIHRQATGGGPGADGSDTRASGGGGPWVVEGTAGAAGGAGFGGAFSGGGAAAAAEGAAVGAAPLPSQAGCLAFAHGVAWPFGAKRVVLAWRSPPPAPPLRSSSSSRGHSGSGSDGGAYRPPRIHLKPGGPAGVHARRLAGAGANDDGRGRSSSVRQDNGREGSVRKDSSREDEDDDEYEDDDGDEDDDGEVAGEDDGAKDSGREATRAAAWAAAARETRAFLAQWDALGEPGEAAVLLDVATAAPRAPLRAGMGAAGMGVGAAGADAAFNGAAGAADATLVEDWEDFVADTRVSPLFYGYLKAALLYALEDWAVDDLPPGASSNRSSSRSRNGWQPLRVAGVALAPSLAGSSSSGPGGLNGGALDGFGFGGFGSDGGAREGGSGDSAADETCTAVSASI